MGLQHAERLPRCRELEKLRKKMKNRNIMGETYFLSVLCMPAHHPVLPGHFSCRNQQCLCHQHDSHAGGCHRPVAGTESSRVTRERTWQLNLKSTSPELPPHHFPTTTLTSASVAFHNIAHETRCTRAPTRAGDGSLCPKMVSFLIYDFILILTT